MKSFRPGARFLLAFLALLLAGLFASRHVLSWPVRLGYPGEQNFVEGPRLVEMLHLAQGVPIYGTPSPDRFDAALYGPLYYLLGVHAVDPSAPAFFPLRLLSILGTLGCAAGCVLLAFWLSRSYLAAALAPLLFLAYGIVTIHGASARSDMVALSLLFGGFLIAYRYQGSQAILLAVFPMLLGFFYKQQFVAGPLAVMLFLLLEKRYRLVGQFVGLLAIGGLGLLAFFQFGVFPGQAFLRHFVVYNLLPFSRVAFGLGVGLFVLVLLVPLLVGLEFLRTHPNRLLACYLGCALVLGLLTIGKEGSDSNYFLESILALSPLFAALLGERVGETARAVELLILLLVTLFFAQWFSPTAPSPEDFARDRAIQDYLRRNFPPRTLALGWSPGCLLRAGLRTPISDPFQYTHLICRGILPERDFLAQIRDRRFGIIVLKSDIRAEKGDHLRDHFVCMTELLGQAIPASYELAAELELPRPEKLRHDDRFYAWVPRRVEKAVSPGPQGASEKSLQTPQ